MFYMYICNPLNVIKILFNYLARLQYKAKEPNVDRGSKCRSGFLII